MKKLFLRLLISLAFQELWEHLADDSDTSDIMKELINAKSKKAVLTVAKREAVLAIDEHIVDMPDEVVDGLINADSTEEVVAVLEPEARQRTLFDLLNAISSAICDIVAGFLGKKK